ncbi:MAG: hypothetical protein K6T99_00110 [Armatimonadetes bacterium]|nr:hypothetical protein [Armatimonadota bacterium]
MKYLQLFLIVSCLIYVFIMPACAQRVELLKEEGGAVENPPESLQLEYKFKVGDVRKYDINIDGEGMMRLPGQDEQSKLEARTTMRVVQHVIAQLPSDGGWRIEWDTIKATLLIPEFGEIFMTVPHIEYEVDKYGKVKKLKGLDELAVCPGLPQQKTLGNVLNQLPFGGFPRKEIKPDETWEDLYEIQIPGQQATRIKVKSRLMGFERIRNFDCAKIETTYEAPFTLDLSKLRKSDKAAKTSEIKDKPEEKLTSESENKQPQKPQIISGTETGSVWTYFAYKEGFTVQVYAQVDLHADIQDDKESTAVKPIDTRAIVPVGDESPDTHKIEHDVDLRYLTVCLLVPEDDEKEEQTKDEK